MDFLMSAESLASDRMLCHIHCIHRVFLLYVFSSCLLRRDFWLKDFSILYNDRVFLLCVFWCTLRYDFSPNDFLHSGNTFSKGSLSCMCPLMFSAVWLLGEGFSTKKTFKGSNTSVYSLVLNEGWLMWKGFSTVSTSIWLLPSVTSLMLMNSDL